MSTPEHADLWAERTGERTYTGHSSSGAEVAIGPDDTPGTFTPGDLMRLALAACNLMSADKVIARRLGDEFTGSVGVQTKKVDGQNRYGSGEVEIVLDLRELDAQAREDLERVITKAVERGCTVGRTLDAGMPHTLSITSET